MAFTLKITAGPGAGQTLNFDQDEVTFGRIAENDVVLYDPNISRRHFQILEDGGQYVLKDLGSSNGTRVNGARADEQILDDGDEISAGEAVFVFSSQQAQVPARRPRTATPATRGEQRPARRGAAGGQALARRGAGGAMARKTAEPPAPVDPFAGMSARERFRARKAAETPLGRLKFWFQRQPKNRKILLGAGGGLAVLLILGLVVKAAGGGGNVMAGFTDYSHQTIDLSGEATQSAFGYGVDGIDFQAKEKVTFRFRYLGGRATLYYDAGWIDTPTEVEIRVNDEHIVGDAPVAIRTWVRGNQLVLPFKFLKPNDFNTITFDNTRNPGANPPETWAVANVHVTEHPLPDADPEVARTKFQLGEKAYQDRQISPSNLARACQYFVDTRDYLERLPTKPPLYDEAVARIKECRKELKGQFSKLRFTAKQYENFNQYDQAKATYQLMLKYFPSPDDPRHTEIKQWLDQLN